MKKMFIILGILLTFQSAQSFDGNIKWIKSWLNSNPLAMVYSDNGSYIITVDNKFLRYWDKSGNIIRIKGPIYYMDNYARIQSIPHTNDIFLITEWYTYRYSFDKDTLIKKVHNGGVSVMDYQFNSKMDTLFLIYYSDQYDTRNSRLEVNNGIRGIELNTFSSFDIKDNTYYSSWGYQKKDTYIALSGKSNKLAVYNDSGSVSILDIHSGKMTSSIDIKQFRISGLTFSDDSKYVCGSDSLGNVFTWDWEQDNNFNSYKYSNNIIQIIRTDEFDNKIQLKIIDLNNTDSDLYVKFNPTDGVLSDSMIVVKQNFKDYNLDIESENIIATNHDLELIETSYQEQDSVINKICDIRGNIQTVSTDWTLAYIAGNYPFIDVMELDSGKLLKRIGEKQNINSIFDSDLLRGSKYFATLQNKSVRLWDTHNDTCLFDLNYGENIKSVRFRNYDSLLFISGNYGKSVGFSIPGGIKSDEINTGDHWTGKLDISESGKIAAIGYCLYGYNDILICNFEKSIKSLISTKQSRSDCVGIINLKICPNEKMLFASFWLDWGLARYIVYDLITYSPLYPFVGVGDLHIDASAFTSDSRVLIMGCDDATIRFSKSDVPEIKRTIKTPSAVRSLTISPNDDLLLATTFDGSIIMYDITSEIILTDIDSYSNDRKSNGITISPNPTSNIIKIQNLDNSLQSLDSDIDISIYNSLGVLMLSLCGQPSVYIGSSGIDVSQFPQGIYNVIISSEYKVWYSKFIKIE